jgi:hypothetical protein
MNEVIALLASSPHDDGPRSDRIRHLGPILARSVLARAGRLVVIGDAVNLLPLALLGAEARVSQELEVTERRRPRVLLVYQPGVGPELEVLLLHRTMDENDQPRASLLDQLVASEAVEARAARDLAQETRQILENEGAQAVFLVGEQGVLEPAVRAAADYGRRSRVPLYSVDAGRNVPEGWLSVEATEAPSTDWRPTLGGRPIEGGEDLEAATAADEEAALAVRLEELLDQLIPQAL